MTVTDYWTNEHAVFVVIGRNVSYCFSDVFDDGETKGRKLTDPMDLITDIRSITVNLEFLMSV